MHIAKQDHIAENESPVCRFKCKQSRSFYALRCIN